MTLLFRRTKGDACRCHEWATCRTTKGAVKVHLLLDHAGYVPVFAHSTEGKLHESRLAQEEFAF